MSGPEVLKEGYGWCRSCLGYGAQCEYSSHQFKNGRGLGCSPTCQGDRIDEECPHCSGTGQTKAYSPESMTQKCKHPRLSFYAGGWHIICKDCKAWWQPHGHTLTQRLKCETDPTGTREAPSALVQLARTVED